MKPVASTRIIMASGFQPDYVREVANAYARIGVTPQVIGGNMHADLQFEDGVEFLNLRGEDKKSKSRLREVAKLARYYGRLIRFVGRSRCTTLYDISIRPFLRCMLMYTVFRLLGKRIIYTAHNVLPHDSDTLLNRMIYWTIYRVLVDAIVVHGQSLKDRLTAEFGVDTDKIHVISHGTYHPDKDANVTKASARERLSLSLTTPVLLFFGLQRPYKGTDFALEAFASQPLEDVTLLIRGHASSKAFRDRVHDLANALPPSMAVNMQLESVPESEMETLFKACDIVVLPYMEGSQSGIKYMAYAYGRPVLASAVGSLGEFIVQGVTGETFATGDKEAFVSTLAQMLEHSPAYSEHAIQGIAYSDFSFEAAARKVEIIARPLDGQKSSSAVSCETEV